MLGTWVLCIYMLSSAEGKTCTCCTSMLKFLLPRWVSELSLREMLLGKSATQTKAGVVTFHSVACVLTGHTSPNPEYAKLVALHYEVQDFMLSQCKYFYQSKPKE